MGASNFAKVETTEIFSIIEDDEFIYEDTRGNIAYELKALDKKVDYFIYLSDDIEVDRNRNYYSRSIGALEDIFYFGGIDISIEVITKTVTGYYEGFTLDYELKVTHGYSEVNSLNDLDLIVDDMIEDNNHKKGIITIHRDLIKEHIETKALAMIDDLEMLYAAYSNPLEIVARLSNGETIYQAIERS